MSELVQCQEPVEGGALCNDWHHPELKGVDGTPRCLKHRPGVAAGSLVPGAETEVRAIESGERVFKDAIESNPVNFKNLRDERGRRVNEK